ncbi:uncharacterized protein YtfP-like [Impatiens glandulifera]|uniref:uncharacterized protein YtfP-like n=1 Tax=Impatiens glandulifera TaxID=253017 RepID=UPI001FB127B1|nr:uncharacterized protein YtfP-like [Impatiens glandulifera]
MRLMNNYKQAIALPISRIHSFLLPKNRRFTAINFSSPEQGNGELLVVVGGGAAGIFGAIKAKSLAPNLKVTVIEKGKPLSKVKISGGGRCNVTNGHCFDNWALAQHYPRGNKEFRGLFFKLHGPKDTMSWFSDHGVELKTEDDGRVFPVSNNSSSVVGCLLTEAENKKVSLQTGRSVTSVSTASGGKFLVKIEKRTADLVEYVEADYVLIASGSSKQGYDLAIQLGHSIIEPVPSLFSFKIDDAKLAALAGVTFPKVKAKLKLENVEKNIPHHSQVGPMLITHWGLSGPAILKLSAWGARELFSAGYKGTLLIDFIPDILIEDVKSILVQHKNHHVRQKVLNSYPPELGLVKRFWKYILDREALDGEILWASFPSKALLSIASMLKQCPFKLIGKGQYKDEFVTAGGVPLSEISLTTMESRIQSRLFFAGEILNVDGVTGGFNFQNAWSGGYIAGTTIGNLANSYSINTLSEPISLS